MGSYWSSTSLDIEVGDLQCRLTRLDDQHYRDLWENSLPIWGDADFKLMLQRQARNVRGYLNLAELYTALKLRFGESGSLYDDWKGAFAFPFELKVFKGDTCYQYVLEVNNWRSTFDFNFRKVLQPEQTGFDRTAFHAAFEEEFSTADMNELISAFYCYLAGFLESTGCNRVKEFVKQVPSNHIIFGFWQGKFFTQQYQRRRRIS